MVVLECLTAAILDTVELAFFLAVLLLPEGWLVLVHVHPHSLEARWQVHAHAAIVIKLARSLHRLTFARLAEQISLAHRIGLLCPSAVLHAAMVLREQTRVLRLFRRVRGLWHGFRCHGRRLFVVHLGLVPLVEVREATWLLLLLVTAV